MIFTVFGKPVGKGRPRFTASGRVYTPHKTLEYEKLIMEAYMMQLEDERIRGAVAVTVKAYYGIAKSDTKAVKRMKESGYIPCMVKPDIDNVVKAVLDALPWDKDDTQVVKLAALKRWSYEPRIEVIIEPLEEEDNGIG